MVQARIIVNIKKRGEESACAVEESEWEMPVLDPLGSVDREGTGATVDEKAPGSRAVELTVDLQKI